MGMLNVDLKRIQSYYSHRVLQGHERSGTTFFHMAFVPYGHNGLCAVLPKYFMVTQQFQARVGFSKVTQLLHISLR